MLSGQQKNGGCRWARGVDDQRKLLEAARKPRICQHKKRGIMVTSDGDVRTESKFFSSLFFFLSFVFGARMRCLGLFLLSEDSALSDRGTPCLDGSLTAFLVHH